VTGLHTAAAVRDSLSKIQFPSLTRPQVPDTNPNDELVYWGATVYGYAMLANVRELLRGVLLLSDERDAVGVYGLARQIFESTAHACYVSRNLKNFSDRAEWMRAWKWLSKSIIGNLYVSQNATEIQQEFGIPIPKIPEPLPLSSFINAYDKYQLQIHGKSDARQDYQFLSEFAHPNGAALQTYYQWNGDGTAIVFVQPPVLSPASFINRCLVDVLQFISDLLAISKEEAVRLAVLDSLKAMISAETRQQVREKR
jgi:hypothetical protein